MPTLKISYKGNVIKAIALPLNVGDTFTLETKGYFCQDDVTATCVRTGTLPPEYQEVEYIESTGTGQIININKTLNTSSYKFYYKISPTELFGVAGAGYNGIMGNNGNPQVGYFGGGWTVGNNASADPYVPVVGQIYELEYSKTFIGDYFVDGRDTGLRRAGYMYCNFFSIENQVRSKTRLYYAYAKDINETFVYEMIPCYRIVDNEVGLYDNVGNTFYPNTGTSLLIAGPDVA